MSQEGMVVDDDDHHMDLEMQLLPSAAAAHNHDGEVAAIATSSTTEFMRKAIRFIQSTIIFTDHVVSRVSSSKTLDSSSSIDQQHDQTVRIDIVEEDVLDQTAPLLLRGEDHNNSLVLRKQMRTVFHVVYATQIFKASLPTAYVPPPHHEATQISPIVDEEIISKIVREKNLQALEEFGGLTRVANALNTDLINGISDDEAVNANRLQAVSLYPTPPNRSFSHHLFNSLKNKTILLLLLAALLSLGFGIAEEGLQNGCYDGVVAFITIFLLLVIDSTRKLWQERKDRDKFQKKLQDFTNGRVVEVNVIREGEAKYICESKLVCGDVILLKKGCQVPGDGLFVQGQELELDYESESCIIDEKNPFLSYGERVINGDATMVVTSIHSNTRWSEMMNKNDPKIMRLFKLETHLEKLNTFIHYTGLVISNLILVVLFFRYLAGKMDEENGYKLESMAKPTAARSFSKTFREIVKDSKYSAKALIKLLSVSLIGVTEGVPFVVSLAIFYWNHIAISGINAIEQDSQAVAKMGSTTRICSDFAENDKEVDMIFIGGEVISACTTLSPNVVEALCDGFCTSTEKAVLDWGKEKFGLKTERITMPSSINMYENESVKEILNKCTHYYHAKGEKSSMDDTMRSFFEKTNEDMQQKQLETVAFACKLTDDDFILVALIGLKRTRMEVIKAEVKELRDCGIETVMVSSKKVSVLKDIALRYGVTAEGDSESLAIIRGEAFRQLSNDERIEKVDKIRVLGEANPSDKLLFIQTLRKKGEVVAFIGQRTDEAPILREADIGISIGTWSSMKARESSDIIICEYGSSTFHDLIKMINSGKSISHNVQRFVQLVLITTASSTSINLYETVAFGDASLTTVELVFVNLAVDFLGGFALLTTSSSTDKLVPVSRGSGSLVTPEMIKNILIQVVYQVFCSVILQVLKGSGMKSMVSKSFIISQFFNQFNARELQKKNFFKGIHKHKEFWVAIVTFVILDAALVIIQDMLIGYGTKLNWKQWVGCVGIGVITWLVDWFGKWIF